MIFPTEVPFQCFRTGDWVHLIMRKSIHWKNQLQSQRVGPHHALLLTSSFVQLTEVKSWIHYTRVKLASDPTTNPQSSAVTENLTTKLDEASPPSYNSALGLQLKSKKVSYISSEWLVAIYHNICKWLAHFSDLLFAYIFCLLLDSFNHFTCDYIVDN